MKFAIVVFACLAVALADKLTGYEPVPVLHQQYVIDNNGNFRYQYETGNGISAEAEGVLKNAGTEAEAFVIRGRTYHKSPEGQEVALSYTADEFGYHPESPVLPVGPEVPEYIIRSLEYTARQAAKLRQ
ncbi:larval cuticle protein LCP-17-like [Chrysoperla carnea]|uniref:larval cuticle protein LCP-17-like n=1 Tax=Chrysoperla carnea TaxID=189513 RepID=UPI001D078EC5|nr:larval cuticle protein LCP-17-like [Chrysoperla carnea]XP_044739546.1 larval cuticle protein LCP-17-like [Chrysoperla carnea]